MAGGQPKTSEGGSILACSVVALLVVLYWLPVLPVGLNLYDEGIRLYGADRILAGQLPYHDFFAYYGPGQFYWPGGPVPAVRTRGSGRPPRYAAFAGLA